MLWCSAGCGGCKGGWGRAWVDEAAGVYFFGYGQGLYERAEATIKANVANSGW